MPRRAGTASGGLLGWCLAALGCTHQHSYTWLKRHARLSDSCTIRISYCHYLRTRICLQAWSLAAISRLFPGLQTLCL